MTAATEPSPGGRLPHVPALDGLRAIAVAAVLLFHADVPFLPGGHLGVSLFFTLSGFLITSLLLVERHTAERVDLRRFWARRARRLVPAMLLCLPLVALVVHTSSRPAGDGLLWDAAAALGWVANWRFILAGHTYADLFSLPSPFQHFWSLAVEEQFYVVFPVLFVLVVGTAVARPRVRRLAVLVALLTVASTLHLAHLHTPDESISRAYYGTDGRIAELLVGVLLALALTGPTGWRQVGRRTTIGLDVAGLVALGGLATAFAVARTDSTLLYRGGFLAVALCTATVLAAVIQPASLLGRALSVPPLVLLGTLSYGVYLFHWPVFLMVNENAGSLSTGEILLLQLGVTLGLALVSYVVVERPVRYGKVLLVPGLAGWVGGAAAGMATIAFATGALSLPSVATVPPPATAAATGLQPAGVPSTARSAQAAPRGTRAPAATTPQRRTTTRGPVRPPSIMPPVTAQNAVPARKVNKGKTTVPREFYKDPSTSKVPPAPSVPPGALKVVMVGDSIGDNLGKGLAEWAKYRTDVVVYNLAVPACPLSRGHDRRLSPETRFDVDPACGWWDNPDSDRYKAFEHFDPDIVVTQDGINESFDRRLPQWNDQWRSPGQPQFDSWLYDEYDTVFGRWTAGGAKIVVTNAPCGDWSRSFQEVRNPEFRLQSLNLTYQRLPGVTVADLFQRVCPNGRYSDTVEGVPDARPDGFHFIPEAGTALAENWLGPLVLQTAGHSSRTPGASNP